MLWVCREFTLEPKDSRVIAGELPPDRQRQFALLHRLCRLSGLAQHVAHVIVAHCQSFLDLGDRGFKSASFRRVASACPNAFWASACFPVALSWMPVFMRLIRQVALGLGVGGVRVDQLLKNRAHRSYSMMAFAGSPVSLSMPPMFTWMSARAPHPGVRVGGVLVESPPPDRKHRLVHLHCLCHLAGLGQQDTDVVVAVGTSF